MARLLVRLAPGVCAMSSRLTSVEGVAESVLVISGCAVTRVDCSTVATASWKWRISDEPDATVSCCCAVPNPGAAMVIV